MTPRGVPWKVVALVALAVLADVSTATSRAGRGAGTERPQPVATGVSAAKRAPADRAPAHPVFTGTWTLDPEKSTFGNIPGGRPTARTDVIEHGGSRIRQVLHLLNGGRRDTTTYVYAIGGAPTVNAVDGRDITSVVTWEGRSLHLVSTTRLLVFEMSLDERWQLAPDGRALVMTRHVKYPLGEGDQRLVFEKR